MSEERTQTFDGLHQSLGTKEGEKSIYRLLSKEKKRRDLN